MVTFAAVVLATLSFSILAISMASMREQRVSKENFSAFVQKQAQALRKKTSGRVKFRVVITDGRAKLKALAQKPSPKQA